MPHTTGAVQVLGFTNANDAADGRQLTVDYLRYLAHHPATAQTIGLVTIAADDVDAALASLVADIGRGSPQGLAASKALTTAGVLNGFDRDAERLGAESARLFVSDEAREGMLAFLEKRPPRWAG